MIIYVVAARLGIPCFSIRESILQSLLLHTNLGPLDYWRKWADDSPSLHSQTDISRNRKFSGLGSDTDIMTASTRAYVSALNKLLTWNLRRRDQTNGVTADVNGGAGDATAMTSPVVTATTE